MAKKYKRWCCWCGKIEYTEFCESKSLDRVIDEAIAYMKKDFKQFKETNMKKEYKNFMLESNKIEGEDRLNPGDDLAIRTMLLPKQITTDLVSLVHSILGEYLKVDWTGEYRKCNVRVGSYFPPAAKDVPALMKEYFKEVPAMDAWTAHNEFEKIHCFQDLNGRTGRLIWLKKAVNEGYDFSIPFLQMFYYQTLNHQQGNN